MKYQSKEMLPVFGNYKCFFFFFLVFAMAKVEMILAFNAWQ